AALNKPYLYEVIEELRKADKQTQDMFVRSMSKAHSNHLVAYTDKNNRLRFTNSDSNNTISIIKDQWLTGLRASRLLIDSDNKLKIDKRVFNALEKKVNKVAEELKTNPTNINEIEEIFNLLGVDLNRDVLSDIDTKGIRIGGK